MPVEIRELVIRAITDMGAETSAGNPETQQASIDQDALIQECVRQVLNILQKKEER